MALQLYHTLSQISRIRRKELILPIARKQVVVSPLSVGDDLVLKTALISPVKLDRELMRLLYNHTEFWIENTEAPILQATPETETVDGVRGVPSNKRGRKKKGTPENSEQTGGYYKRVSENEFYNTISYFDKLVLIWGIYSITYETLGEQEITCPHCEQTFKTEIVVDDTMHEDSLTLFEEGVPFNKYTETIKIPFGDQYTLEFTVGIPSMADFNRILGMVPVQELQRNLETIKSQFNTEQLITLYTKKLAVYENEHPDKRSESSTSSEILSSVRDFVNIDVGQEFFKQYTEHFKKYGVRFYKKCECPHCKNNVEQDVDLEFQFFLRQLPR